MTRKEAIQFKRLMGTSARSYVRDVLQGLGLPSDVIERAVPIEPEEACSQCGHQVVPPLNLDLLDPDLEGVELAKADAARFAA